MMKKNNRYFLNLENFLVLLFAVYFFLFFLYGSNSSTVFISEFVFFVIISLQIIMILILKKTSISKGLYILFPFTLFLLAGVLYSPNQNYSLIIFQTFLTLLVFVYLIINTIDTRILLERLLLMLGIASLGISLYTINLYGLVNIFDSIIKGNRIGYDISQPNTLGYYAAIGFLIFFYHTMFTEKKILKILSVSCSLITILIVIATISRRALIISALGLLLLLLYKKTKVSLLKWIVLASFIASIIAILQIPQLEIFSDRLNSLSSLFLKNGEGINSSDLVRANLIESGLHVFSESFLWGHGTGAFRFLAIDFIGYEVASHNNYIELLVNHGVLGFIFYYLPILYVGTKVYSRIKKEYDPLGLLVLVLLVCDIIIAGMTSYTYYSKMSIFIYSLNIVYLALSNAKKINIVNK